MSQRGLDIEDLPLVIHYDIADSTNNIPTVQDVQDVWEKKG